MPKNKKTYIPIKIRRPIFKGPNRQQVRDAIRERMVESDGSTLVLSEFGIFS